MKINIGRFQVTQDVMRNQAAMLAVMDGIAAVDVESNLYKGLATYTAYGTMFEPVDEASVIPFYDVTIQNGLATFTRR